MADPDVLGLAADLGPVVVSHDRKTMPGHFFLEERESPGLILVLQAIPLAVAIDEVRLAWACMEPEEFRNRIVYLSR